jgi:hypothetical protein
VKPVLQLRIALQDTIGLSLRISSAECRVAPAVPCRDSWR